MIALRQDNDTYKSFPSGHTSNAAATYFTSAAMIAAHYQDPTINVISYTLASVLTGITGYSRVRYGKHHISDTLSEPHLEPVLVSVSHNGIFTVTTRFK